LHPRPVDLQNPTKLCAGLYLAFSP
jgi:hypothetical protein